MVQLPPPSSALSLAPAVPFSERVPAIAVLFVHVLAKGTELGSLVGLGLGSLSGLWLVGTAKRPRSFVGRALKVCELGGMLGLLGSAALLGVKYLRDETMDNAGIEERAYRLVHSVPGIKAELDARYVAGGLVGGAVVGTIIPDGWLLDDSGHGDSVDGPSQWSTADRVSRGFAFGGALAFASGGGLKVLYKFVTKTFNVAM